ncbi:conserved Plasmodium protein, unknown function [Plasmodium ovale]|uniref:Uncharacterized protein n=2 Tax=Plasmodium ovale TaxID=36330 RepID=A0A1D3KX08_PLAOA|nr:conserved Plasmodium protein, unknown function [Plasmodium ovale]
MIISHMGENKGIDTKRGKKRKGENQREYASSKKIDKRRGVNGVAVKMESTGKNAPKGDSTSKGDVAGKGDGTPKEGSALKGNSAPRVATPPVKGSITGNSSQNEKQRILKEKTKLGDKKKVSIKNNARGKNKNDCEAVRERNTFRRKKNSTPNIKKNDDKLVGITNDTRKEGENNGREIFPSLEECEHFELGRSSYLSSSELLSQSDDTSDSTISDASMETEEGNIVDNGFVQIFERIDCRENCSLRENRDVHRNVHAMGIFELQGVFANGDHFESAHPSTRKESPSRHQEPCEQYWKYWQHGKYGQCWEPWQQSRGGIIYEHLEREASNKRANGEWYFRHVDIEKRIIEDELSRKILIFLPFFKKRIFIDAIVEHFEADQSKNEVRGNDLKAQCYDFIREISDCVEHEDAQRSKVLSQRFREKISSCSDSDSSGSNECGRMLEMGYYEFEFFSTFFLTYFRFSLYLAGFVNSSFLYHSNEIHFHIFVLNRYHHFVDNFEEDGSYSPFTPEEANEIVAAYKKSIISVLDYLDAFYPFFVLIRDVIEEVNRKSKGVTRKLRENEFLSEDDQGRDIHYRSRHTKSKDVRRCPARSCIARSNRVRKCPARNCHVLGCREKIDKFNIIKKINKVKRKFFKSKQEDFMQMVVEKLSSYWIGSIIPKEKVDMEVDYLDIYIERMILNIKNNMLMKYIICTIFQKLNIILSKLEKKIFPDAEETCIKNIFTISELLNLDTLKKMKKRDKWFILLKQNYFYIEKSYYFFKELHEKKIIYYQIQNLFRSILSFKINIIYNPFVQYFYISDVKNKKVTIIYDDMYCIKNSNQKDILITIFAYKELIYKLKFDVTSYGYLFSIYTSLKFLFLEKASLKLIKKNEIMKSKFMYLFSIVMNSLSFNKFKNVPNPIMNILKISLFHKENKIVKRILSNATNKINQMLFRGHIRSNAYFSCLYKNNVIQKLHNVVQNIEIMKLDKNYIVKEVEKELEHMQNRLI